MPRNPGKYKARRGGGRHFSRHLTLDSDGIAVEDTNWRGNNGENESSDEKKEQSGDEEDESEEGQTGPSRSSVAETSGSSPVQSSTSPSIDQARAQRKAAKKARKQGTVVPEEDKDLINPNHLPVKHLSISDVGAPRELSRREREAKEKEEAKKKYWKLHQAGKTDEAKADLARLRKIREEREAAQAARKKADEEKAAVAARSKW